MFDLTSLWKRWLTTFTAAEGQAFVSSHSPVKNPPHDHLMGKEEYGYDGGCQYHGSFGTSNFSCDPRYSLLVGIPTAGLPQSHKEIYTRRDNIVGKISIHGFLGMFLMSFLLIAQLILCASILRRGQVNFYRNRPTITIQKNSTNSLIFLSQKSSINPREMSSVLVPVPPATAAPTAPDINKRGHTNRKRTSRLTLFRGKKKKIQDTPTPFKHAATESARSKAKNTSKPNSLPGDKVISEK